jgi:transposase
MYEFILGVDVSKKTLDVCLIDGGSIKEDKVLENNLKGIKQLQKWLFKHGVKKEKLLVCLEHTGVYVLPLQRFLSENKIACCLEMPLRIINSGGVLRGKNDKVDAFRIARYALKFQNEILLYQPPTEEQSIVKDLTTQRDRLMNCKKQLMQPIEEYLSMGEKNRAATLLKACRASVKSLEKEIKSIEVQIDELIKQQPSIKKNQQLAMSVPGIGKWISLQLILATDNFQKYKDAKKLSCYCGCAPFEHRSGSSIRGRTRVSHMANKKLKSLLTLGALAAARTEGEMRNYYLRKIEEGKSKMLVLNAIRNKLIHRVLSVISRGENYSPDYRNPLAA